MRELAELTDADFEPLVGSVFNLVVAPAPLPATLTRLRLLSTASAPSGARRRPFALELMLPAGTRLPQAIYRLEHPAAGTVELFLVPLGPEGDGMVYEAVFT